MTQMIVNSCVLPLIHQTSAVKISQVMYQNISGTTKSAKAMMFACSDTVPCSNIILTNINLDKKDGTAETYCNSAEGFGYGTVHPSADCLSGSSDKDSIIKLTEYTELTEPSSSIEEDIVHTEL